MEPLQVHGGKGVVNLEPRGFLHLVWSPKVRIEEADAQAAMATVNEAANGSEYPLLVDMATTSSVSRRARAAFSIPCAASRIALLGHSPVDRVLANFLLTPQLPLWRFSCTTIWYQKMAERLAGRRRPAPCPPQPRTDPGESGGSPPRDRIRRLPPADFR